MNTQQRAVVQQLMEKAYLAGFMASGDGYNGQCPFDQCGQQIESYEDWRIDRDDALRELLEQPEQACPHGADSACKECHEAEQPTQVQGPYSAPIKHLWGAAPKPADLDYKQLYEQLCEQYDVLVNKVKAGEPDGDELTIAYMDGMYQGKQMAKREWVGLTQQELDELRDEHHDDYGYQLSTDGYERAIEAKLREKNGGAA